MGENCPVGLILISTSHIAVTRLLPHMQNLLGYPWKISYKLVNGNPQIVLPPMTGRLNGQILLLLSPLLTVFWMLCLLLTNAMCISLLGVADSLVFRMIRVVPLNNKNCLYMVYIFLCSSLTQGL